MSIALIALIILWWALIAYAVLGGADFGAGIWDLLATGSLTSRQRDFINHALGPVWEANHVWLIFLIVGLFTIFPSAFAALAIALFFPFSIVLIGIVLRGAAFIFRYYSTDETSAFARWWGRVFSAASLITPFFLGAAAAAVASGNLLRPDGTASADSFASWTTPFALTIGAMAVSICAVLAAVYLTVEAKAANDLELVESYRLKALIAGAVTAGLGALGLVLSINEAPILWRGMLQQAVPVVIATMIIGAATAAALFFKRYRMARVLIIAEVAFLLSSWGLSQYPFIIPPHFTIYNAANDPAVIEDALIATACGMVLLLPSLYFLFAVFKLPYPAPGLNEKQKTQHHAESERLKQ